MTRLVGWQGATALFPGSNSKLPVEEVQPPESNVRQIPWEQFDQPPVVLIVAENASERRIIVALVKREGCRAVEAASGKVALTLVSESRPDLVILDRDMGEMDGLECCLQIKSRQGAALTPLLMLTTIRSVADEVAGFKAGADGYLSKPLHPEVFRSRIRALIRNKAATDRLEESEAILFALAQAVEKRDHLTAGHCQRLALLGVAFGMRLGLSEGQLLALHRGGYLHDIGKIAIPDAILFKPGKLTPEEWVLMKTHCVRGEEICKPLRSLGKVLPIIRNHHERWDGGGYPDGLRGEKIPLLARVLQLADVYDALTSERPYKAAFSTEAALQTLASEANMGWRDPELTELFALLPFDELDNATRASMAVENAAGFEESIRNLQSHLLAVAS